MNEYFLDRLVEAIPMLRRTCYRYVVDSNRADDLLQETLLKAIYNSDRYVENGKLHAWLSVIMANTYENCRKEAARMVTGIDCRLRVHPRTVAHTSTTAMSIATLLNRYATCHRCIAHRS